MADHPNILDGAGRVALLDKIVTILGGTKMAFYPFLTSSGRDVFPYGEGNDGIVGLAADEAGNILLEAEFDPMPLGGGNFAYYFDSSGNLHINVVDNAAYSHGNGTVDTAFSLGAWIMPTEALGTVRSVLAKYGPTANLEEYDFRFDASGNLILELHDASASASEIATGTGDVLVPWTWNFICATYDGDEADPSVGLWRNGVDQNAAQSPLTVETGAYVAMEDVGAAFLIGARDATGTPAQEFEGYMALPFITGKQLTAADVAELYGIGQQLIGLK